MKSKMCICKVNGFIKKFDSEFEIRKQFIDEADKIAFFKVDEGIYFLCSKFEYFRCKVNFFYDEIIPVQVVLYCLKKDGVFDTEFGRYEVVRGEVFESANAFDEYISTEKLLKVTPPMFFKSFMRKFLNYLLLFFIVCMFLLNVMSIFKVINEFNYVKTKKELQREEFSRYVVAERTQKKDIKDFLEFLNSINAVVIEYTHTSKSSATILVKLRYGEVINSKYNIKEVSRIEFNGYGYAILNIFEGD